MARLCTLFSGSSGNSYYIGGQDAGILVDAGRSAKQITLMLEQCGIPLSAVKAVFVTHEHTDHVQGLRVFASRNHIKVYASAGTLRALDGMGCLNKVESDIVGLSGMECAGMFIKPFHTSHDCAEGYGYRVTTADGRTAVFSTDLGFISPEVQEGLSGCDLAVLESNHDVGMLRNGAYPYPLKQRILSDRGHLSNEVCAQELPVLAKNGTTRFVLAHLSRENNTPDLAYQTAVCSLTMAGLTKGLDYELLVAPRENTEHRTILF
ncbi:MAG TPA: MBL fold metallo-hydrolase [Candidatus Gallacutalibacter pullicola]|uniref:MBL fold metallo-hydrolase n=1 Tax=Candidatus Gallacutalibacter pullicola TaxID=2840830 RepID=A0A9D1DPM6_9FIRM|nr:MBL fold metallo-hydrolase [Candidatus Gallacutalibacter pullicola]